MAKGSLCAVVIMVQIICCTLVKQKKRHNNGNSGGVELNETFLHNFIAALEYRYKLNYSHTRT